MGLINNDTFVTGYGHSVTDTYISIGNNNIELVKSTDNGVNKYMLSVVFNIWLSKESRSTARSLTSGYIRKELSTEEIIGNLYEIIYSEIKLKYTNTTDEI